MLSEDLIRDRDIPYACVQQVAVRERLELERHDRLFCGDRHPPIIRDRTVILIDDGLATGLTMQAAILALRQQAPARIVVAVPVGARETCERLRRIADCVVCLETPDPFSAVGLVGRLRHDLRHQPVERRDADGHVAPAEEFGAMDVERRPVRAGAGPGCRTRQRTPRCGRSGSRRWHDRRSPAGGSAAPEQETDTNVEQTERRATGNRRTLLTKPVAWVLSLEFVHEPKWTLHFCAVACSDVICCRFPLHCSPP